MKWLICSLLLASSASVAKADCDTEAEATDASTCVVMARGEHRGVWFSLAEADGLRRLRLEVPELQLQVASLEQAAVIQADRVALYQESTQLRASAVAQSEVQLEASLVREHQLRVELGAWHRSPALWFAVGVVVTSVAAVSLGYAASSI